MPRGHPVLLPHGCPLLLLSNRHENIYAEPLNFNLFKELFQGPTILVPRAPTFLFFFFNNFFNNNVVERVKTADQKILGSGSEDEGLLGRGPCTVAIAADVTYLLGPNLVPRVLRFFGQRLMVRRDAGEFKQFQIF